MDRWKWQHYESAVKNRLDVDGKKISRKNTKTGLTWNQCLMCLKTPLGRFCSCTEKTVRKIIDLTLLAWVLLIIWLTLYKSVHGRFDVKNNLYMAGLTWKTTFTWQVWCEKQPLHGRFDVKNNLYMTGLTWKITFTWQIWREK